MCLTIRFSCSNIRTELYSFPVESFNTDLNLIWWKLTKYLTFRISMHLHWIFSFLESSSFNFMLSMRHAEHKKSDLLHRSLVQCNTGIHWKWIYDTTYIFIGTNKMNKTKTIRNECIKLVTGTHYNLRVELVCILNCSKTNVDNSVEYHGWKEWVLKVKGPTSYYAWCLWWCALLLQFKNSTVVSKPVKVNEPSNKRFNAFNIVPKYGVRGWNDVNPNDVEQ